MLQKPKGTKDYFNEEGRNYIKLVEYINNFMSIYNYNFIKTPIFETSELFKRSVGENTDIVNKETYDFIDKSNRNMTLKPEETASVVRCFLENKLYALDDINKFYYITPCFRYERPQAGRFREFNQFGVEVFGSYSPYMDAEVIILAYKFLTNLGIKNLKIKINSLGNENTRKNYREALINYFKDKIDNLCDTCKERYKTNPLRILDCKVDNIDLNDVPNIINYLDEESKNFFEELKNILKNNEIPFEIDNTLVRGLDYYTHTVFEIIIDDKNLGKANTICGGGRYNNLVKELGNVDVPAVGFAIGIERLLTIIDEENIKFNENRVDVYIMNLINTEETFCLLEELREAGYVTETNLEVKPMKNLWKQVDKYNPSYVIILGEDELKENYVTIKDNATKENIQVKRSEITEYLNLNV